MVLRLPLRMAMFILPAMSLLLAMSLPLAMLLVAILQLHWIRVPTPGLLPVPARVSGNRFGAL
jgi:hypothetical protein